jgi:hypothetical protein
MAVTEPQRLDLHAAARAALGPEEGDTLMASLPPANTDIATRQDVERAETGLRRDIDHAVQRSEASMKAYIWKVVVGTGVALYVATVGTIAGLVAVLLQVVDRV